MLFQLVSRFGENLVENGNIEGLGFIDVAVAVCFVIDEKGSFIRAEKLNVKQEERKKIPIGVYPESFSDAEEKRREYTHSLFEHLYVQKDEAVRNIYYDKLSELAACINNERLSAIMSFIKENDLYELAGLAGVTDEKDYFCVAIENDNGLYEIWNDEEIVSQIGTFLLKECRNGDSDTDIFGRKIGRQIKKHSRVLGKGSIRARAVSQKIYNDFYGGNENDNTNACVIGSLSELYFNYGMNVIKDNGYECDGCVMYMGDIKSNFCIPFNWSMTGFCKYWETRLGGVLNWEQLKEILKEKAKSMKLFFVAFDNVNKGRISTYKSYAFIEMESYNIICNILEWIERSTIYAKGEPVFSFYTYIYEETVLKERKSRSKKEIALLLVECVIRWDIRRLWDTFFQSAIREAVRKQDKKRLNRLFRVLGQLWKGNEDVMNIWEDDILIMGNDISASYLGGVYLACVYLLEKKLDHGQNVDSQFVSMVEKRSEYFRLHPLEEMGRFRENIEKRMKKVKTIDKYKYTMLLEKMSWLQKKLKHVELPWKLTGEMYVAFDITISQYWEWYNSLKQGCRTEEEEYGI